MHNNENGRKAVCNCCWEHLSGTFLWLLFLERVRASCQFPRIYSNISPKNFSPAFNRDPARWENPQQFDIHRKPLGHCAFASGPHMCRGMHLARMETRVVIDALMARLPNLRLDPAADDVHISGLSFRSPRALPVVFD